MVLVTKLFEWISLNGVEKTMSKIRIEVDLDDLNAYDDADIIMGIFRKYLQPIKESERNFLNSGGQSMGAMVG